MGALDLQVKYPVTYPTVTHHQLAVQVKTGRSFASWTQSKNRWRLNNIDKSHVEKWRGTNQPVLLLWVRLDPHIQVYWKLIGPTTPISPLSLSENHRLTPAARFEIERLLHVHKMDRKPLAQFTVPPASKTSKVRQWSAPRFAKIRGLHPSPLGLISITNYAWRHLTRVTRSQSHIVDSLTVLPYVTELLKTRPHQLQTVSQTEVTAGRTVHVSRKVLAIYRDVRFTDKGVCVVYVRLDEKISYPRNWQETGLIRGKVQQDLRLESVYRKPA